MNESTLGYYHNVVSLLSDAADRKYAADYRLGLLDKAAECIGELRVEIISEAFGLDEYEEDEDAEEV